MTRILALTFLVSALSYTRVDAVVTFDWAMIGNPGNAADDTGFGAVDYSYRISKYEVTNAQYVEFLNAVDPDGVNKPHNIFSPAMADFAVGGIEYNVGGAVGSKYIVRSGRGRNPVIHVTFLSAMRFVNWLENGQPTDGSGTESGVYTISDGLSETRAASAAFFIPSEDEWYKAAYHKNDGVTGNYWDYPTSTDAVPYSDQPPGGDAPTQSNTANIFWDDSMANSYDDGYAVTGLTSFDNNQNYLTDVGAYTQSASPYGTFDQGGNVHEWNESRIVRGGGWGSYSDHMAATWWLPTIPTNQDSVTGFRVASAIPEPGTRLLGSLAAAGMLVWRRWAPARGAIVHSG